MKLLKNLLLSTAICSGLALTASAATPFTDLNEVPWAESFVETAYEAGCITGKSADIFDPNGTLSLAEFSVMLTKAWYGTELAEEMSKHQEGQWGDDYISTLANLTHEHSAASYKYIMNLSGYEPITRYSTAYITGMLLVERGLPKSTDGTSYLAKYLMNVNNESQQLFLGETLAQGIMAGRNDTDFDSYGTLSRAEACVIITKLLQISDLARDNFDESNVSETPVETLDPEEAQAE